MVPKGTDILITGTCKCVMLHEERELRVANQPTLKQGDCPCGLIVTAGAIKSIRGVREEVRALQM